jgi:hypothetical protein
MVVLRSNAETVVRVGRRLRAHAVDWIGEVVGVKVRDGVEGSWMTF